MGENSSYNLSNHSTETALAVLELLAKSRESMRLRDISETLMANSSTVLRFLNTLVRCGYVEQNADNQRYRLTYKICRLASQVQENTPLQGITHPYVSAVSDRFKETCCVSIENDMQMVYIDTVSPSGQLLMSRQQIGGVAPMHCTGNGKLLLLNYSLERLDTLIASKGLNELTPNTITERLSLISELDEIRRCGYAQDIEECELGVRCLAYPIYNCSGKVAAGISITGPVSRMTENALKEMHSVLSEVSKEISIKYGAEEKYFNN